jgi:hypothetical protein
VSTKFNSPDYLYQWKDRGLYPAIHDNMTYAAQEFLEGPSVLDLCCSFGLLGERIKSVCPKIKSVIGIDCETPTLEAARTAGISIPLYDLMVLPDTVHQLMELIVIHKITTIVARRALPELFSSNLDFGRTTVERWHKLGVKELLIEGRIQSRRTSNALGGVEMEIDLLKHHYQPVADGRFIPHNVAYLKAI